ncbi:hypothetical protein V6N13_032452 [Hibiscus sabdariffa]
MELNVVLGQKEESVMLAQKLSMKIAKLRKDLEQKDKILSAMLRKSKLDTAEKQREIKIMNREAVHASPSKTGMIVLGGRLPKHHICNADMMGNGSSRKTNLMRDGADYAVYINTAQELLRSLPG